MIKVGVIGTGKWGINHLRVFSELDCKLVGLADIDKTKKEIADNYHIKFFTNYKDLLPLVDAVSVVVPTDLHYKVVKDCLNAKKHVLVEKPITNDSKTAEELVQLAKEKGVTLAVGYLFRFNSAVNVVKEEIKKIGDLQYITARYIHSNKPPRKDCGVVFNFGIHLIDILNYVLDRKPTKIFCEKINYLSDEREDCAIINLVYDNFMANLEMSWFHPLKKRDMWIIGSRFKLYVDLLEQTITKYPIEISVDKTKSGKPIEMPLEKNEPLKDELKAFCNCIENKSYNFKGNEEIMTTKICEKALESAKQKKELMIDE